MQPVDKRGLFWLHPNHRQAMRSTSVILMLLASVQFLVWLIPGSPDATGIPHYLPLHVLLETVSIVVSMMVFAVGWNSRSSNLSGNIVLLASVLFSVGMLDFLHTLSYGGMPDFISLNDSQKHLYFWLSARFFASVVLLVVAIRPWQALKFFATRYVILGSLLLITALIGWMVIFHHEWLPDLFVPGVGLTAVKKNAEYLFIAINIATAAMFWKNMRKPQTFNAALLFGAVCTLAMSEFYFTLYTTMTGSYNVLGHIYKVIAYLFIYRAIVVETIEEPYNKLAQAQQNLATALQASNTGLWDWELESGYVSYSIEWKAQLGYSPGDLPDQISTWETLLHPDDRSQAIERAHKFLASSQQHYENEFRLRHRDGSFRWIMAQGEKQYDSSGKLSRLIGSHIDITERKINRVKLERLSRAYRLLGRVNEAIVRAQDRKSLFADICSAACESKLFCLVWIGLLDEQELAILPVAYAGTDDGYVSELNIRLDDIDGGGVPAVQALREGKPIYCRDIESDSVSAPWRVAALKRGYRSSGVFPIFQTGKAIGIVTVYACEANIFAHDIEQLLQEMAANLSFALDALTEKQRRHAAETEIRQLNIELEGRVHERTRQLESINRELETFSYSVSHDLRAPLRSIDGFSQVLLKNYHAQLDATGQEYLNRVRRASQRMGSLIDDLLKLSQVTRGKINREQLDLSAIAEKVFSELSKTNPAQQLEFTLQPGLIAYGDAGLLHIVMVNLLGNACKYSSRKAVAEIEFGMREIDGERVFFVEGVRNFV